jgi:hypothetical protein
MNSSSPLRFTTRILWLCVVALFVLAEVIAALALRNIPNDHLFLGLGTKYGALFTLALPMVAGMNGYRSVRRRLSSAGDEVISVLSVQFLLTIVTAYVAVIVCMGPLTQALAGGRDNRSQATVRSTRSIEGNALKTSGAEHFAVSKVCGVFFAVAPCSLEFFSAGDNEDKKRASEPNALYDPAKFFKISASFAPCRRIAIIDAACESGTPRCASCSSVSERIPKFLNPANEAPESTGWPDA